MGSKSVLKCPYCSFSRTIYYPRNTDNGVDQTKSEVQAEQKQQELDAHIRSEHSKD